MSEVCKAAGVTIDTRYLIRVSQSLAQSRVFLAGAPLLYGTAWSVNSFQN